MKKTMKVMLTGFLLLATSHAIAEGPGDKGIPVQNGFIKCGAYKGKFQGDSAKKVPVHMMIHPIPGREASFLAVMIRLPGNNAGGWAEMYVADPVEAGKKGSYTLTPFRLKPNKKYAGDKVPAKEVDYAEIEITNANPSFRMTIDIKNGDYSDPHFVLMDAGNGAQSNLSQMGTGEFNGLNSDLQWSDKLYTGQFKAKGVTGKVGYIHDWSIGQVDRTQQAVFDNFTSGTTLQKGYYEIREKIAGIFSLKRTKDLDTGTVTNDDSTALAFFYDDFSGMRRTFTAAGAHNMIILSDSASKTAQSGMLRFVSKEYDGSEQPTLIQDKSQQKSSRKVLSTFGIKSMRKTGLPTPADEYEKFTDRYAPDGDGSAIRKGTDLELPGSAWEKVRKYAGESDLALRSLLRDVAYESSALQKREMLLTGLARISARGKASNAKLLMTTYINETLKLVSIIDTESKTDENINYSPAGLIDLEVRLLMRAGRRALDYFESDLVYINGTKAKENAIQIDPNATPKPNFYQFVKFSTDFVEETLETLNSVVDATAQYNVLYELARFARYYMADVATNEQRFTGAAADAIDQISIKLDGLHDPSVVVVEDDYAVEKVRKLRGILFDAKVNVLLELKQVRNMKID